MLLKLELLLLITTFVYEDTETSPRVLPHLMLELAGSRGGTVVQLLLVRIHDETVGLKHIYILIAICQLPALTLAFLYESVQC